MNTVAEFCDRVIYLEHGKVKFDGEAEEGVNLYRKNL